MEKTGADNPDDPSNKIRSRKSWIWDQYLPGNMKLNVGNMGSISINKHGMDSWIFGTSELWNFETKTPRNFDTKKPRNQETFLFSSEGIQYPSTYRPPPLRPTTFLGDTSELGAHDLVKPMSHLFEEDESPGCRRRIMWMELFTIMRSSSWSTSIFLRCPMGFQ